MKNISDKLIDKYIDNDLSNEELKEFNSLIENDEAAITKIKATKFVESTIAKSEVIQAPFGFTENLMHKISTNYEAIKNDNKFFKVIISIFSVLIVSIFAVTFATASYEDAKFFGVGNKIQEFINTLSFDGVINLIQDKNFLMIAGGLVILIGFSVLLVYESHKNFKHKLNTYLQ